ncbi:unnamed protein product [Coccothraustes coccothraustes]
MEAGALEAEARGVAYVLTVFTAGVNELLLVDFIETVGKAPRQGLISRRRPGLRGPNHSTSVMAFGAKGSEKQGRRCRCSAAGTHRALLTGEVRPEGPRRGGQSPPRAPGAPPRRQPGMRSRQPFSLALQNTAESNCFDVSDVTSWVQSGGQRFGFCIRTMLPFKSTSHVQDTPENTTDSKAGEDCYKLVLEELLFIH